MFNLISKPERTLLDKPKKKPTTILRPGRIKRLTNPGNVYATTAAPGNLPVGTRANYQLPEYDLGEVARVMDIEAYVRQAFDKHTELCMKEGWKLVSRNKEAADYVDMRLSEIAEASGRTFSSMLRGIISNMVIFANCFIVKVRKRDASSGMPRKDAGGATLEPVAGYFLIDPTSVHIKRNLHGTVAKYRQIIPGIGDIPEFWPENMIHLYYDRKEGFGFGTPYVIPVLDDIRTLRRLEENVEMLTVSHLYPLFQYKVGTETHPAEVYEDGTTEVDLIKTEIERMPTEGSIVTPDRHEIIAIGAQGEALDVSKYLEHFEKRVLSGLGISDIALGRGGTSNRATAASIDRSMQDRCKEFQEVTSDFINEYMLKELLLEGGYLPREDSPDVVKLVFNEIDIDTQIKKENHSVFKYEHDVITESEVREDLGKDPFTEEQRNDMYFEHVTKPKAIIMAVDEPYTAEAKTATGSKSAVGGGGASVKKVSKEEKKKKATLEREQPSNQHGRKLVKTKTKKDELLEEAVEDIKKLSGEIVIEDSGEVLPEMPDKSRNPMLVSKLTMDLKSCWNMTREDVLDYVKETYIQENRNLRDFTPEKLKMILFLTKDMIVKKSGIYVFQALRDGAKKAGQDCGRDGMNLSFDPTVKYQYLNERIEFYSNSLLKDLGTQLVKNINPDFSENKDLKEIRAKVIPKIMGIFDALEYRLNFTSHTEVMKSYNFGYALAARDMGYKEVYIKLAENNCDKCREAAEKPLSLEYFSFEDVAPVHPMCNCTYTARRK